MRISIILILFATTHCVYSTKLETTTLRVEERVRLLKEQIRNSLRNPSKPDPTPACDISDENAPIQPILEERALKKRDKFRPKPIKISTPKSILRTIKTQKTKAVARVQVPSTHANVSRIFPMRSVMQLKPSGFSWDIFYRKSFLNNPLKWLHCAEMVTPYIKGVTKELKKPKLIQINDHLVMRFVQLLSSNTTSLTRDERKAIMYQISILNMRLFSWHSDAITALLQVIIMAGGSTDKPTFRNVKAGMEALLRSWTVDLSNTTTLLLHSRLFRPPCVQQNGGGGSSKFVRGSTVPAVRPVQAGTSDEG